MSQRTWEMKWDSYHQAGFRWVIYINGKKVNLWENEGLKLGFEIRDGELVICSKDLKLPDRETPDSIQIGRYS